MSEENTNMNMHSGMGWGLIIFFLILFWIFSGGGFGPGRGNAPSNGVDMLALLQSEGAMGRVKNFDLEKQNAMNTAELAQAIHNLQDSTIAAVQANTNQLAQQARLHYDANIGEKMFDLKLNALAQQQGYEAKLAAKDATIERMQLAESMTTQFNTLQAQIAAMSSNMLTKPQVTGVGAVCPNAGIINGLGIGSSIYNSCTGTGTM